MSRRLLLLFVAVVAAVARVMATDIYVKAGGSVADALKQAREWRRLNAPEAQENIFIHLADTLYRLNKPLFLRPEDSGTAQSKTVIIGGTLTGAKAVSGWRREGKLWVADAPRQGNRIVYARQLWVNGKKATRARGETQRLLDFDASTQSVSIPKTAVRGEQLEMFLMQRWAIAILRIKEMKDVGDRTIVTFHDPESQLEFAHPWPQPVIGGERGNSGFFLTNALALLDEPGEWYQDYPSGRIYYMPRADENIATVSAEVPCLETLLELAGTEERKVEWVMFKGTRFEGTAWNRPSAEGHVTLQGGVRLIDAYKLAQPGLFHKATLENQAWIARPEAAVTATHCQHICFSNCTFRHIGATAIDWMHAVSRSNIDDCNFNDIGGTAIMVGDFGEEGFETHIPYQAKNLCDRVTLQGNRIDNATNEDWGCAAISAGYVSNIGIVRNEISNVNYSGICVGWGWTALENGMHDNIIAYNRVYNYACQLYDAGGIYTLSNQPYSCIYHNIIAAPAKAPFATNERAFAIYFDEATDGYTVMYNNMPENSFGYNQLGPNMVINNNDSNQK